MTITMATTRDTYEAAMRPAGAARSTAHRAFALLAFLLTTMTTLIAGRSTLGAAEGADVIGTRPPAWQAEDWQNSAPLTLAELKGKVVLVRWWTAPECPHCAATAPSLNTLYQESSEKGLVVIGMYHHKSPTPLDEKEVVAHVKRLGFLFPVAIDRDWTTLKRWWLDTGDRSWTSVSFLIDRHGIIRHVHTGGRYEKDSADYRVMKAKVEELLGEKG